VEVANVPEAITPAQPTPRLLRFFITTPDPLPLPDGWTLWEQVGNRADVYGEGDDPWVFLTVYQREAPFGRTRGMFDAVNQVLSTTLAADNTGGPSRASGQADSGPGFPETPYTVVDAVTMWQSPDRELAGPVSGPGNLLPRADAFNRCLRLIQDLARAYRLASEVPYSLLSYETIPPVIYYSREVTSTLSPDTALDLDDASVWQSRGLMLLEHLSTADAVMGPLAEGPLYDKFVGWMQSLRIGNPFFLWWERFLDATRALRVLGEYPQAVVLAATASEVLLDATLLRLLWEEGVTAEAAASLFEEGKVLRRVHSHIAARLGGNWSTDGTRPFAAWYRSTYLLRHRVVHAGHRPARGEAQDALDAAYALSTFIFDRLAARRNVYPRTVLLTLARAGLQKRGLYSGKIKAFNEYEAATEPNWAISFRSYQDEFNAFRLAKDV